MDYILNIWDKGYIINTIIIVCLILGFYLIERFNKVDNDTLGFVVGGIIIVLSLVCLIIR